MIDSFFIFIFQLINQPTFMIVMQLMAIFGWIVLVWMLFLAGIRVYADYVQEKKTENWKYVLLAIDVPQENVQTPKAVEQMFAHLAGAYDKPDLRGKFRDGYKQRWFSFEIISIEGYIQFLVWTEQQFRDLVEAAMYAQYPEAEITEVEDYVSMVPNKFPNDTHEVWIGDFTLAEKDAYPIRSYQEFEHSISKDTVLKDPMGTFLESFTRIGQGEQMWFQIIVEPTDNHWKEKSIEEIKKLIGEKSEHGKSFLNLLTDNFISKEIAAGFNEINNQLTGGGMGEGGDVHAAGEKHEEKNQIKYLTPGQSKLVESMEEKMMKIGFKTKMRTVYIARKEVFNTVRGVNAVVGALNQYNIPSANSIVPKITTTVRGEHRKLHRKNELLKAFKKRKIKVGSNPFILNIEELATVWHFPMSHVKTPLLQKATMKAAEPPAGLPVESLPVESPIPPQSDQTSRTIKTDSGEEIRYEDVG